MLLYIGLYKQKYTLKYLYIHIHKNKPDKKLIISGWSISGQHSSVGFAFGSNNSPPQRVLYQHFKADFNTLIWRELKMCILIWSVSIILKGNQ